MAKKTKILAFGGSLRKGSYNKALLKGAIKLAPDDALVTEFDIKDIPIFNQDLESRLPESVSEFKREIREADAVLIVTPEYNYSIPGFIKNAIDWASRPYNDNVFNEKPVAIISSSGGFISGSRAQYHLRQVLVFLNAHALNKPEVMIPFVNEKIDSEGNITDDKTKEKIREQLIALVKWSKRLAE